MSTFANDKSYPVVEGHYQLGDICLQRGGRIPQASIAYKTFGSLNLDKSNAILYPTWYSGFHSDNEWLIGEGMALDPTKYFIIIVSAFGNGLSSSPSNTAAPYNQARFPHVTLYDNVIHQHRLVTEHFHIDKLQLVVGWSMGKYDGVDTFNKKIPGSKLLAFRGVALLDVHISQAMGPFINVTHALEWVSVLKSIEKMSIDPNATTDSVKRNCNYVDEDTDIIYQVSNLISPQ